ncbi:MAG: lipopolysaccharide kinase InaA family protein [Planctomycetota bacterium]
MPTEEPYCKQFRQDGWWGWRDASLQRGTVAWVEHTLSEGADVEVFNQRVGSRLLRATEDADDLSGSVVSYVKVTTSGLGYLLTHLSLPAAWAVWSTTQRMRRRGLSVPVIRFAAARQKRGRVENVVVMDAVPGPRLTELLVPESVDAYRREVRRVAIASARLHDAGFIHGDLLPGNVILPHLPDRLPAADASDSAGEEIAAGEAEAEVVFIDNDRTRLVWGPWRFRARYRNVSQMCFRLRRRVGWREARLFLEYYLDAMHGSARNKAVLRQLVIRKTKQRSGKYTPGSVPPLKPRP